MKLKRKHYFLIFLMLLTIGFFLGPRPDYPPYTPDIAPSSLQLEEIEAHIARQEAQIDHLRPGNNSIIRWADSVPSQTEYVVVMLHGFSASPMAGTPVVSDFAERYGFNYYAPLLAGHGLETEDSFVDLSPADLVNSAKAALAIARKMGKKTLLFASSTGCTLGAYLAAHNPEYAHSLFFYSPNIDLADPTSRVLLWPWGQQIASLISGKYYKIKSMMGTPSEQFWTVKYRIEGLVALKHLIHETMNSETFAAIQQPLFLGYWYKNDETCDKVVSIPRMKDFFAEVATPEALKRMVTFPETGAHVLLSDFQCKDIADVSAKTVAYAEEVLGLIPR